MCAFVGHIVTNSHLNETVIQCFLHKKFFSGSVKKNYTKGKLIIFKGRVNSRFIFGSTCVI